MPALSCGFAYMWFGLALALVLAGHLLGAWLWRFRTRDQKRWRFLYSAAYLLNANNYERDRRPVRYLALGLLLVGGILAVGLALTIATSGVLEAQGPWCGLSFAA